MSLDTTIRALMHDADNLMVADEPVKNAQKQFELETARSLILVDSSGPVGLLTRSSMQRIPESDLTLPARAYATPVPLLQQSWTLAEARQHLGQVDFDAQSIPVVNEEGRLVGAIDREVVLREAETVTAGDGPVEVDGRIYTVQAGMTVLGIDDNKLGKVDEITLERERVASFTVAHGLFGRHHKRLAAEHITRADTEAVYVDFGKTEFGLLSDIEEREEDRTTLAAS